MDKQKLVKPEFRKNESFYIREGWFSKAINCINDNKKTNIFNKNDGIKYLGIGSNRVKGLRYWLSASGLIDEKNQLTDYGNALIENDPYLERKESWYLIHWELTRNQRLCPIFNYVFSSELRNFTEQDIIQGVMNDYCGFVESDKLDIFQRNVEKDTKVFLQSYAANEVSKNPEEYCYCPLSDLELIKKKSNRIQKNTPPFKNLSEKIIAFTLSKLVSGEDKSKNAAFDITALMNEPLGPARLFNLDKTNYYLYLDILQRKKYIKIVRTAGLNTVYFEQKLLTRKIEDVFKVGD